MARPADASLPDLRTPPLGAAIVARALTILAAALAPLLLVPLVHNALQGRPVAVALILGQELAIAVAVGLNRTGRVAAAGVVFTSGAWLLAFGLAAFAGEGLRDVVMVALAPILLAAGVLAGPRYLWALTSLTLVGLAMLWLAEQHAWITPQVVHPTRVNVAIDAAVIVLMTAAATSIITGDLRRTLEAEARNAAALERSEQRFRTAIELAADGILLADTAGTVTEANTRACALLGRARGEVLGRTIFDLLPLGEGPTHADLDARLDRGDIVTCERTLRPGGPSEAVVEMAWQRLPDRTIQCFLRDISTRRRLEEQLRHAQKMEAVGALAGGIAHDFNNLVTVMQGFLELIEADPNLSGELADHVAELRTASSHAADLTQQLLAFAGRKPLDRRVADVRDLLSTNQRLIARLAGEAVKVALEPSTTPCPVFVDAVLITQVLLNLAANARDAMPAGGRITLGAIPPATRTPPRLGPEGFVVRDYVGIRFSDTGCGMPPETAARIFEPFFTTKQTGRNAGLGLAMVHGIVERHGGWVEAESTVGQGTTFSIYLPAHAPAELAPERPAPRAPAVDAPSHGAVLVVDDDAGMRRLATHVLAQAGYRVVEADSGPEALEAWEEHAGAIDLIFTDMVMPGGMNGVQLIEACRARRTGLPAILTSGYTLPPIGMAAPPPADVVMLAKPYANSVLLDTVRALLAGSRPGGSR
ncbi:MAG: response regulator [Opitutaceae bacterium]|nr:response regulator [Opitutaceae bacterium]